MSLLSSRWRCAKCICPPAADRRRPGGHQTGPQRGLYFSFVVICAVSPSEPTSDHISLHTPLTCQHLSACVNICFCLHRLIRTWGKVLMKTWWNIHKNSSVQQSNKLPTCCTIRYYKLLRYYCCHYTLKWYYYYWINTYRGSVLLLPHWIACVAAVECT